MIDILLIFFLISLLKIGSLYFANIAYYPFLLIHHGRIRNNNTMKLYICFLITFALSIVNYIFLLKGNFSERYIIQVVFTLQYFVFFIDYQIDTYRFEKHFKSFALVYSLIIIIVFFLKRIYSGPLFFYIHNRMWGNEYFSGWPNSTGLPIVFALFLSFNNSTRKFFHEPIKKITYIVAILLTTSRTTLLGAGLVILYGLFVINREKSKTIKWARNIGIFVIVGFSMYIIYQNLSEDFLYRLFYISDRTEIMNVIMDVLNKSPLLGWGGTSLDSLQLGNVEAQHSHNFILEILFRYGLIGFVFFMAMLFSMFKDMKGKDNKIMFLIMWFMALFQIYVRDFCFLFLVSYLCCRDRHENDESILNDRHKRRMRIRFKS